MPEINVDPKALGAVGVLGLVLLFMYFPSSMIFGSGDMKAYRRLQEIHSQLERAKATDPGALSSLGQTLIPDVSEIVDRLEKQGAGASMPIKQQLFFAGKYCLIPMLQGGGNEGENLEVRLKNHLENAGRLLKDPNVPPLPPPDPNAPVSNEDEDYEGA